jgi:hypothetical protein
MQPWLLERAEFRPDGSPALDDDERAAGDIGQGRKRAQRGEARLIT